VQLLNNNNNKMPVVMATTVRRIKQEMKIRRSQSMIASSKCQFSPFKIFEK